MRRAPHPRGHLLGLPGRLDRRQSAFAAGDRNEAAEPGRPYLGLIGIFAEVGVDRQRTPPGIPVAAPLGP